MSQSNILEKVEKDIESYGWHVLAVCGGDLPNFSYTIGFKETLSHPEIVMSGLSTEMMHHLLNDIGELIKSGESFSDGDTSSEVIKGYLVKFISVNESHIDEYFRAANIHYGDGNFKTLQCIWPDNDGRFPETTNSSQEVLV
jgi:hypothetical protein